MQKPGIFFFYKIPSPQIRTDKSKVPSQVEFRIPFIKLDQTESLLNKLDTSKATGLDDLGPHFLRLSAEYIAPSITCLINLSILEGVFPSNLKIAKISPLFKSGDKSLPGNYRSICFTHPFKNI